MVLAVILTIVIGNLLGNLNGAILISRLVANEDIRHKGSGNAGFTNFFRNYGGKSALVVMAIDFCKAVIACILGGWLLGKFGWQKEGMMLGAVAVSLGHDFPALLGFRGGKGIMCGIGTAMAVDWRVGLVILAVFLAFYLSTKYVSLGSIMGGVTYVAGFALVYHSHPVFVLMSTFVGLLAIFMHRENIRRLITHTERKTDFFKREKKS